MSQPSTDQPRIIIVDDTPESLEMLSQLLMIKGYNIHPVTSGQEALPAIHDMQPDLVLLDIMMPDMNGFEVCRHLKADAQTRDIPVIFISALHEAIDKVKAFEAGGVDYVTKPYQVDEVLARVGTHLKLRDSQRDLERQNTQLQQANAQLACEVSERKQTEETLQQRNRELLLLNQVSQMSSSSLELEHVLDTILGEIQRLLDVFSLSFWLIDETTGELVCMQAKGPGNEELIQQRLPLGRGITGWVAQNGECVIIPDTWEDERHFKGVDKKTGVAIRSMLSIPLRVKGEVIGVINLVDLRVGHFTQDDLLLLEPIAATAASSIKNARLYTTAQQEIAERKRVEEVLRNLNQELKQVNDSKDKFFSIISHDLRSSFHVLLGYTQLCVQKQGTSQYDTLQEDLEKLLNSAEKLYALLENLLTWSRIQRGVMEYEPEPVDLYEVAEDNVDLFLSKAHQKNVALTSSVPPATSAYADFNMIKTVVRNLTSNALKFTNAGDSIVISAWPDEQFVQLAIADTGIGMDEEIKSTLFRIDTQYTSTGTAGEKGTGLGLILCKELVERNGGRIWVESEQEKGATFRFTLPRITPGSMK